MYILYSCNSFSFFLEGPIKKNVNLDEIGLRQYTGPKVKRYITVESRVKSFNRWPERVVQKPEEMAEAGFFYCGKFIINYLCILQFLCPLILYCIFINFFYTFLGLSDHVRCFHCGNGLRNWENDDNPWIEHIRWYPDCNFVLLSKGQEYINNVRISLTI